MPLKKLSLRNYRNYNSLDIEFDPGVNIIYGDNGVGKTNLIEAIYYLSNLNSFRTNKNKDLINKKESACLIEGNFNENNLSVYFEKDKKELKNNEIILKKHRDYIGLENVISFSSIEVYIFEDLPGVRRKFIDIEISKIDKGYVMDLLLVNNYLKKRNEILKSNDKYKERLIEVIDEKLASVQEKIICKRKKFIDEVSIYLEKITSEYQYVYKIEKIEYETFVKENVKKSIIELYKKNYKKDEETRTTNYSVKKDDFKIKGEGIDIATHASQGEKRLLVLMLKMAIIEVVNKIQNKKPILVLDDAVSELDKKKKKILLELIKNADQVFITSCDIKEVNEIKDFVKEATIYKVKDTLNIIREENYVK